jgi:actin-related protein
LPFVLEAKGQVEDHFLAAAQSKVKNASQHATAAAYALFKTQLDNDATLHRKQLLHVQVEGTKKRQAVAVALQAAHDTAWDLIQKKAADEFPTFMYANTKDLSSAAVAVAAPWIQDSLQAVSNGLHRAENDRVVYWANLCVLGAITVNSAKFHWLVDFLTAQLAQMPLNSVAVVLLGNRAPAKSVKKR